MSRGSFGDEVNEDGPAPPDPILIEVGPGHTGTRLDKALADLAPAGAGLSRSRLRALIEGGAVAGPAGATVLDPRAKVKPGEIYAVDVPPPAPAKPAAEASPLDVIHDDPHLIVVNKPAGMVVHPAPGAETGTLVNALLAHCGDSLSGIGGEARPGIVHRIDKDTSGLLVVAKTDAAHQGLAALFAAHDIERSYRAIAWGAPDRGDPRVMGLPGVTAETPWLRIEAPIARRPNDRKRMGVVAGGRRAVTRVRALERFGPDPLRPLASLLECRLETGRTHQIRVHLAHLGHGIAGDPLYGRGRAVAPDDVAGAAMASFPRQALHAATLGFRHPITRENLDFSAPPPQDFTQLLNLLRLKA
jgi:23S rRNA pseudouridine1911/1915/1917 synthase